MGVHEKTVPLAAAIFGLATLLCAAVPAIPQDIPPHKAAIKLFDGSKPDSYDTFLRSKGLNSDPNHVFQIKNGVIHISGTEMGYLITKESYHDFYLRAEFKWGKGTFGEQKGKARDSGILYNIQGEQKVWPRSIEFQITEGGTGDFWMTDGAALTSHDGKRVTAPANKAVEIAHFGRGPIQDVLGFRDPVGDLEKPYGEWNVVELVTHGNDIKQYVNGKLANEGTDPFPASGKILLESEGGEIYYRNIQLYPLK